MTSLLDAANISYHKLSPYGHVLGNTSSTTRCQTRVQLPAMLFLASLLFCADSQTLLAQTGLPAVSETQPSEQPPVTPTPPTNPRELLEFSGIDAHQLGQLSDQKPLDDSEQELLLKILYRLRTFDLRSVAGWMHPELPYDQLLSDPSAHQAQFYSLQGQVKHIESKQLPPQLAERFELQHYYLCTLQLAGKPSVLVITPNIPQAWKHLTELDERASAAGLFLKVGADAEGRPQPIFLAQRIAWLPDRVEPELQVGLSQTILGNLGMDLGRYDDVENRTKISGSDREAFYQLLSAVGRTTPRQLFKDAQENLRGLRQQWEQELPQLSQKIQQQEAVLANFEGDRQQRSALRKQCQAAQQQTSLLQIELERAAQGKFSVVPLFNTPNQQHGQLVVLEGTARRAVKVVVGAGEGSSKTNADILERYKIADYYELEVFTDDSQNNPIVFCVRSLPAGFPTGDAINEHVRIAGFFFKTWAYYIPETVASPTGTAGRQQQLAPLLIGAEPLWLKSQNKTNPYAGVVAGGLFVIAALGIWYGIWCYGRSDRRFHTRTIVKAYTVDPGTSLNQLGIDVDGRPKFDNLELHDQTGVD